MLRSTASKVAWVGRTASMVFGLALVLALIFGVATTALSATGGNFILGKPNSASSQTSLVGTVTKAAQSALVVVNKGTGSALKLQVANTNSPPMKVNSSAKVANLNADLVDGQEASAFSAAGHNHDDSYYTETESDGRYLAHSGKAADADKLDNMDSSEFLGKTEKATDADKLDNRDSTSFANATHQHSGADITSGTVAEARIHSAIARDSEVANGYVQGRGQAVHGAYAVPRGNGFYQIFLRTQNPNLAVGYFCPQDLGTNGWVSILNEGTETLNVFSDNGGTNPNHYGQLSPNGGSFPQQTAASGEFITFQVQGTNLATIEVFSVHRENDCHVQAQALVTRP